jgi:nitrate reductase / nitrite oxidoreductase, beta subunit
MNIKAHVSMVFHLDKCIGCHTCSIACKNIWTDREGADYMWWNNVETKPGTGFPQNWENQEKFKGGWVRKDNKLTLKSQSKSKSMFNLFYNPNQPGLKDYYEPWTYKYKDLFDAPESDDQPTAMPISKITGEPIEIKKGPNWDDDLSGSEIYAKNDKNLDELTQEEKDHLMEIENISMMYLPRICNHCTNPSCVAACPSGAIYKRGEDGIVLVNQDKCRGWRACVSACPYKKIYYNWKTGKSEKCILCYPRLETGQAPSCFESCVGRIRYMGVLLYDADKIESSMNVPDKELVESQRSTFVDPFDPEVIKSAKANGVTDEFIESAQNSPVYKYVVKWKIALPLHIEYRTAPMLFYVPSLLPVMGRMDQGLYTHASKDFFTSLEKSRMSVNFLANLFSAGNTDIIDKVLKKLLAVRYAKRIQHIADVDQKIVDDIIAEAGTNLEEIEEIFQLTALATKEDRFSLPPIQREEAIEDIMNPEVCKGCTGLGETIQVDRGQ